MNTNGTRTASGDKPPPTRKILDRLGAMLSVAWGAMRRQSAVVGRFLYLSLIVLLSVAILFGLTWILLYVPERRWLPVALAVVTGIVGIYPVSYLAYVGLGAGTQRRRLIDDFRLLGLVDEDQLIETVEKLYQTVYNPLQYILFIGLIILVFVLVLSAYLYSSLLGSIGAEAVQLAFFAFLGAYVFSVQELIRRFNTFDLQPQVYSSILMRTLIAVIITLVGASVISLSSGSISDQNTPEAAKGWAAVLAFVIGAFPTRGIRWFSVQANQILGPATELANERPLRTIIGISAWHEARLDEMGIDDAQNLATFDIRRLLLTTQFDTQEIVHWIDQAILYVKVGSKIDRFRDAKINTFHELRVVLDSLSSDIDERAGAAENRTQRAEARKRLAAVLGLSDADELERLGDYENFPNYTYLAGYYMRVARLARQRAETGLQLLTGALEETNYQRAVEEGERLLPYNQDDPDFLTRLGRAYHELGRLADAEKMYERALAVNKNWAKAYYNRSLIRIVHKDYQRAVQDCTRAIEIDRTRAEAFNNRGIAYMELGYLDRAIEDLNEALRLNDRLAEAYFNLGIALSKQGDYQTAVRDFENAYLLNYLQVDLWFAWGVALLRLHNYREAIQKLSQAVLYQEDLATAYAERGYAYLQLGPEYYPQARVDLTTAIQKDANLVTAHANLGLLEARQNNYVAALKQYEVALGLDSGHVGIRYNLALAYYQLKRINEASGQFQIIIDSAPKDSFEAEEARAYLQLLNEKSKVDAKGITPLGDNGHDTGLEQRSTTEQVR